MIFNTMEILEKIFGTKAKVKLMRLFLFNPDNIYSLEKIIERAKENPLLIRKELLNLSNIGLIKKKKRAGGWVLNEDFIYINELRYILLNIKLVQNSEIVKRFQKSGRIKLIVVAGIFIQNPDSRLDLLIVGDGMKKAYLENAVKTLESEIGKDLKYVWLNTEEFNYRISMYDKLIRDVLDFPHEKLVNRLNV